MLNKLQLVADNHQVETTMFGITNDPRISYEITWFEKKKIF